MIGLVILFTILIHVVSFLCSSFIVWLGSLIFSYDFSWLLSLFIWLVLIVLRGIFKQKVS